MSRRPTLIASIAAVCLVAACTSTVAPDDERSAAPVPVPEETSEPPPEVLTAELHVPDEPATVLAVDDPLEAAVAVSSALFVTAPVAVLAPADDVLAQLTAASHAVTLAVPLLLAAGPDADGGEGSEAGDDETGDDAAGDDGTTAGGTATGTDEDAPPAATPAAEANGAVVSELERLGVSAVLAVGSVDTTAIPEGVEVVEAPDDVAELEQLLRVELTETFAPSGEDIGAVIALDRDAPTVLAPGEPEDDNPDQTGAARTPSDAPTEHDGGPLPYTEPAPTPEGALLLIAGHATDLAPAATARAAGWDVVVVRSGDPRTTTATVQALATATPEHTLAVGSVFGDAASLEWKVRAAATGVELPGGGQVLFPHRRMVALYGTPSTSALGLLGEQGLEESIARAQAFAAEYQALTDDLVVPAFEIIVTIASAGAGADGQYSNRLPAESFVPWIEAARDAGVYVVLDLQPGRTDFLTQAQAYESLLRYPNVGLALDPEWRLSPDQVHLRQIGSVGIDEVNSVVHWLADLTNEHALPQKLLVLHQFTLRMISDRGRLDTSREELALMIHADGQGSQPAKQDTWRALRNGAPDVWWGWKNFIDEDEPMLTPAQTYGLVDPVPHLVTYQ